MESPLESGSGSVKAGSAVLANRLTGILGWAGVFVAGVLTYSHWFEKKLPCGMSGGCDLVTQSEYSKIGNIPVAVIGLLAYLVLVTLATLRPLRDRRTWRKLTNTSLVLTGFGFLASVYFIYTSISILKATCLWCVSSAIIMTLLLIVTGWLWSCPDPDPSPQRADSTVHVAGLICALGGIGIVAYGMDKSLADKGIKGPIGQLVPMAAKARGPENAPITVIEFADFNCPTCRSAAPDMDTIFRNSNGKIRWCFRNFPLIKIKGHETSMIVATISELAANKNLFWPFFDAAYKSENTERIKSLEGVKQVGLEVGLKTEDMNAALSPDSKAVAGVKEDLDLALQIGVEGTPSFVILAKDTEPKMVTARRLKSVFEEEPYKGILGGK